MIVSNEPDGAVISTPLSVRLLQVLRGLAPTPILALVFGYVGYVWGQKDVVTEVSSQQAEVDRQRTAIGLLNTQLNSAVTRADQLQAELDKLRSTTQTVTAPRPAASAPVTARSSIGTEVTVLRVSLTDKLTVIDVRITNKTQGDIEFFDSSSSIVAGSTQLDWLFGYEDLNSPMFSDQKPNVVKDFRLRFNRLPAGTTSFLLYLSIIQDQTRTTYKPVFNLKVP